MLFDHNIFQQRFVAAFDALQQIPGQPSLILDPQLYLVVDPGMDQRRYHLPIANDVIAILPDEYSEPSVRDVLLYHRNADGTPSQAITRVNRTHAAYFPLQYPLLFPYGTPGWHYSMPLNTHQTITNTQGRGNMRPIADNDGAAGDDDDDADDQQPSNRLTQRPWYRYHLFDRNNQFSAVLQAGRLFEQFVVDAWASIDQETLEWHRRHQKTVRAELYTGVMDALAGDFEGGFQPSNIGQPVILAPSYLHGDRANSKFYQVGLFIPTAPFPTL